MTKKEKLFMLILGIDTTTKTASTAVVNINDEKPRALTVLSEIQSCSKISHSENLMPMIDYTLKCAGVSVNDIDLFAVSHGPGSFTGIRIGIATVKGLAFEFGNETEKNNCVGISSLYALAYNFYGFKSESNILILPVIDARRKQVYNAVFDNLKYIKNDRIITVSELETELNSEFSGCKIIFDGDGADMCYNEICFDGKIQIPDILKKPSAVSLCRLAYKEYRNNRAIHPRILAPSYLIKTQAEREYNGE